VELPNLEELTLASAGIKSIGGLKRENFSLVDALWLSLRGNPGLNLDEGTYRSELLQEVEPLRIELGACKKGVDMASLLPKLKRLSLTREKEDLVEMECSGEPNEKLKIILGMNMNVNKEEFKGLRALHGRTRREMEVDIKANRAQMSQKRYKHLVNVVPGECKSLKRLVLEFETKQKELSSLEFLTSLEERGAFPGLKSFEVIGVNAFRMGESLGAEGQKE